MTMKYFREHYLFCVWCNHLSVMNCFCMTYVATGRLCSYESVLVVVGTLGVLKTTVHIVEYIRTVRSVVARCAACDIYYEGVTRKGVLVGLSLHNPCTQGN